MKSNNSISSSNREERTVQIDSSSLPLGYRLGQADNVIKIDPDTVALVRRAHGEGDEEVVDGSEA